MFENKVRKQCIETWHVELKSAAHNLIEKGSIFAKHCNEGVSEGEAWEAFKKFSEGGFTG